MARFSKEYVVEYKIETGSAVAIMEALGAALDALRSDDPEPEHRSAIQHMEAAVGLLRFAITEEPERLRSVDSRLKQVEAHLARLVEARAAEVA